MQENEKKKVGLFGKIKNILFVDDDDDDQGKELPDYTEPKEEKEKKEKVVIHENPEEAKVIPSRFDIEKPMDDIVIEPPKIEKVEIPTEVKEEIKTEEVEEKPSPFLSFDEDEFKNFTSRVARNEARTREETKIDHVNREKPNYNLPPTSRTGMSSIGNTTGNKKPFTPSPVISPVYGILDKNYSKEDIIDKRTDRRKIQVDSVDRVRKKALGEEIIEPKIDIETTIEEDLDILPNTAPIIEEKEIAVEEKIIPSLPIEEPKVEEPKILTRQERSNRILEDLPKEVTPKIEKEEKKPSPIENELNEMIDNYTDLNEDLVTEEEPKKSNKLDDLEKTSTLKILDDIEKELNSIKPENSDDNTDDKDDKSNQILEKDIFNMISSMYVGGDEEDDRD